VWWGIYTSLCYKFPTESNRERILKIGKYLVKLWARVRCLVFLTHSVVYREMPSKDATCTFVLFMQIQCIFASIIIAPLPPPRRSYALCVIVHCHVTAVIHKSLFGLCINSYSYRPTQNFLICGIAVVRVLLASFSRTALLPTVVISQLNSTENYGRRCLTPLSPHHHYTLS